MNRPKLVFFGYTGCPNICPRTLAQLSDVQNLLARRHSRVKILMITTDPKHDTPKVLAKYLAHFHADTEGLTGRPEDLTKLYADLRVYPGNPKNPQASDHSGFIYLADKEGRILTRFTVQTSAPEMAHLITTALLQEKTT